MRFIDQRAGITIRSCPPGMRPDLTDAALEGFVNACLAWQGPDSGYPLPAYVTLRVRGFVSHAIRRLAAQRAELGREHCVSDMEWLTYQPSVRDLDRALDRADLQRWADLADLSPMMRWGVEFYATHGSPRDRANWYDAARAGVRHMRLAAKTNRRRDDHWTRARAGRLGEDHAELHRLYIHEGLTLSEIAARLGLGAQTVAKRLRAGGTQLRARGQRSEARAS